MEGMAPILHVADARAGIAWYAQLGFEVESEHTFGPDWPLYVRLRRGSAQLHLSEHRLDGGPRAMPNGGPGWWKRDGDGRDR